MKRRPAIVLGLALAGALWFAVSHFTGPAPSPFPDYAVTTNDASPSVHVRTGNAPFEITLRPSKPGPKVVAYAFAIGEGEPNPIDAKITIAPDGVIHIEGRSRALEGARELRVVVGAPESIKRFDDALTKARDGKSDAQARVITIALTRD
jgi:hypothetical protein